MVIMMARESGRGGKPIEKLGIICAVRSIADTNFPLLGASNEPSLSYLCLDIVFLFSNAYTSSDDFVVRIT